MKFESKYKIFNNENAFENVVCEVVVIMSRERWVNGTDTWWIQWQMMGKPADWNVVWSHACGNKIMNANEWNLMNANEWNLSQHLFSFRNVCWIMNGSYCDLCLVSMITLFFDRRFHEGNLWTSQWRHNEHDGFSNHQCLDCFFNCLFRRKSKKTSNPPVTGGFPLQRPATRKIFPLMTSSWNLNKLMRYRLGSGGRVSMVVTALGS